jgi:hypothetical protein
MKFGKSFERELEEGGFPKEWISASIQYKQLKVPLTSPRFYNVPKLIANLVLESHQ